MSFSYPEKGVFRQTFAVRYPDVDAGGFLRLTSLLNFLQIHGGDHAQDMGFDYHANKQAGQFWVLSRLSARFDAWATWPGDLTIDSWTRDPQGLLALRDYRFGDERGWHGRASTAWALLKGRRPQRLTEWTALTTPVRPEEPVAELPPPLPAFDWGHEAQSRAEPLFRQTHSVHADWEDIDLNAHVNNVNAVGWCLSQHEPDFLMHWRPISLDVNFLAEMFHGQKFAIVRDELPAGENRCFDYLVLRDGDQTPTLRLRMTFTNSA